MQPLLRMFRVIASPASEWERIAAERSSAIGLLARYLLPLALLGPLASTIGMSVFDRTWSPVHGYAVPAERILATGVASYFVIVSSVLVLAAVFASIAPMFECRRDYGAALKVAIYGAIPVLLAGATLLLPVMALVGMAAFCHSLFLFWMGAQRVLKIPAASATEFVGVSMVLFGFASSVLGAAASAAGLL